MSDVEIFQHELRASATALSSASTNLLTEAAQVFGEDTGVGNPAHRTALRLELHRRLDALHDVAYERIDVASALAGSITEIADSYADLDVELTGQEN